MKAGLQKYGRTGMIVYLGLSTCVTAGQEAGLILIFSNLILTL